MKVVKIAVLLFFMVFFSASIGKAEIPAFPGAEGFGTTTAGGRGGTIYNVTNLNDSGEGSLRACMEAKGPRVCIIKTGGWVDLESSITVSNPYLTVAGQTAPNIFGLRIKRTSSVYGSLINIGTHDVVIMYITVRAGPGAHPESSVDALGIASHTPGMVYNVVIDHVSMGWTIDQIAADWHDAHDITFSWNIFSEPLHCSTHEKKQCHGTGLMLGSYSYIDGDMSGYGYNNTVYRNLFAHCDSRNPYLRSSGFHEIINNVIYNPGGTPIQNAYESNAALSKLNIIGNLVKGGPDSVNTCGYRTYRQSPGLGSEAFLSGNIGYCRKEVTEPESYFAYPDDRDYAPPNTADENYDHLVSVRWDTGNSYSETSAARAYTDVLDYSGNYRRLSADGSWAVNRDAVDKRILYEVQNGTGKIIDAPGASTCLGLCRGEGYYLTQKDYTDAGVADPLDSDGWPVLDAGTPYLDTDGDGMPDVWESTRDLNPRNAGDAWLDRDGDGYSNLEEFIYGISAEGDAQRTTEEPPPETGETEPETQPVTEPEAEPVQMPEKTQLPESGGGGGGGGCFIGETADTF